MTIGDEEVFGPVLCIKTCKDFEDGLAIMNANPYANGSVIYTQSGYYARQFARYTDGGQVGINVGIPVPVGFVPFSGHKQSFFGDLHCLGKDAYRFFTESKSVTQHWFDEEEKKQKRLIPGTVCFNLNKTAVCIDTRCTPLYCSFIKFRRKTPTALPLIGCGGCFYLIILYFSSLANFAISFFVPALSNATSSKVSLPIGVCDKITPVPNAL